jgi:small subunit ribosomal protein S18
MAETKSGGRPIAASQRPTGGDKALAGNKKQFFRRKKVCRFCVEKIDHIDYKDVKLLSAFVSERGKITPRRISGVCCVHQRLLATAIKQSRNIALLPFTTSL